MKWQDEKDKSDRTSGDESAVEHLQLSSRILAGTLAAGAITTFVLAFCGAGAELSAPTIDMPTVALAPVFIFPTRSRRDIVRFFDETTDFAMII